MHHTVHGAGADGFIWTTSRLASARCEAVESASGGGRRGWGACVRDEVVSTTRRLGGQGSSRMEIGFASRWRPSGGGWRCCFAGRRGGPACGSRLPLMLKVSGGRRLKGPRTIGHGDAYVQAMRARRFWCALRQRRWDACVCCGRRGVAEPGWQRRDGRLLLGFGRLAFWWWVRGIFRGRGGNRAR